MSNNEPDDFRHDRKPCNCARPLCHGWQEQCWGCKNGGYLETCVLCEGTGRMFHVRVL